MDTSTTISQEQRRALHAGKLRALVREHFGSDVDPDGHPTGALATADGIGWALVERNAERGLGAAIAWSMRQGHSELHVLAGDAAPVLARRATQFAVPPRVWQVEGADLDQAVAADPPEREALPDDPAVAEIEALLIEAGIDPVIEFGALVGEVYGLEVARVVVGPNGLELQVGVGRHDRDAFQMMHGDMPTAEALRRAVDMARRHRGPAAAPHALNRISQAKLLRSRLIERPDLVGAELLSRGLAPVEPENVKDDQPAVAVGTDPDGQALTVVTVVGVDLDVIAHAADARLVNQPGSRLIVAMPARDALPVISDMASMLADPAEIVTVDLDAEVA